MGSSLFGRSLTATALTKTPPFHNVGVQRSTPHFTDKYPYVRYSYGNTDTGLGIITQSESVYSHNRGVRDMGTKRWLEGKLNAYNTTLFTRPNYQARVERPVTPIRSYVRYMPVDDAVDMYKKRCMTVGTLSKYWLSPATWASRREKELNLSSSLSRGSYSYANRFDNRLFTKMSGGKKRGRASKEKQTPSTSQTSTSSVNDEEDEAGAWDCSVCTFRNKFEAFSCLMCETRKGTSTRKPRLNDNIVAVQKTVHDFVMKQQTIPKRRNHSTGSPSNSRNSPESTSSGNTKNKADTTSPSDSKSKGRITLIPDHLIYRTSPKKITVVARGKSVTITEYRRKPAADARVTKYSQRK
ncbi:hypothetical protein WR25_12342 [Diploscapter pachys]|uniref:RanBP2-type domain-containing protein n=1 Tax=Diploscapter pachys TaxID=2018661 RepID=A0A2A2LB50_9BILA|nr:hypothetical protein WR25_12342 [Diploscapter pachys]